VHAERVDERAPPCGLVRIDAQDDRPSAAPEAGEVVDVGELDAALKRAEENDERDPEQKPESEADVGTTGRAQSAQRRRSG
jgi:hypothetical protein